MNNDQRVQVHIGEDNVATVTLTRPDKSNSLDGQMFDALITAGERLRSDTWLRAQAHVRRPERAQGGCGSAGRDRRAAGTAGHAQSDRDSPRVP
jgi:enoyl-CoA hydratase/carnithine racemase